MLLHDYFNFFIFELLLHTINLNWQAKGNDFAMKSNEAYESSKQCQKNTDIVFTDPTVTIKYSKKFGNGVQNNSVTEFDSSNFKSSTSTMRSVPLCSITKCRTEKII